MEKSGWISEDFFFVGKYDQIRWQNLWNEREMTRWCLFFLSVKWEVIYWAQKFLKSIFRGRTKCLVCNILNLRHLGNWMYQTGPKIHTFMIVIINFAFFKNFALFFLKWALHSLTCFLFVLPFGIGITKPNSCNHLSIHG